jgi:hypothetical protein
MCEDPNCIKECIYGPSGYIKLRCAVHKLQTDVKTDRACCTICKKKGGIVVTNKHERICNDCQKVVMKFNQTTTTVLHTDFESINLRIADMIDLCNYGKKIDRVLLYELSYIVNVDQFKSRDYNKVLMIENMKVLNERLDECYKFSMKDFNLVKESGYESYIIRPTVRTMTTIKDADNRGYAEKKVNEILKEHIEHNTPRAVKEQYRVNPMTGEDFNYYDIDFCVYNSMHRDCDEVQNEILIFETNENQHKTYVNDEKRSNDIMNHFNKKGFKCWYIGWNPNKYTNALGREVPSHFKKNVFDEYVCLNPVDFKNDVLKAVKTLDDMEVNTIALLRYDGCI